MNLKPMVSFIVTIFLLFLNAQMVQASTVLTETTSSPTYQVVFGYGTFNLTINSPAAMTQLVFDYGSADFQLPGWGAMSADTATITQKELSHGLYEYTIVPKDSSKNFGTTATLNQIPLMTQSPPTKNMDFDDYYGLMQNMTVNGQPVIYADQAEGAFLKDPTPGRISGGYYADWTVYGGHGGYHPTELPFGYLNTIYYAFGGLNPTSGKALMFDPYADAQMSGTNAVPYLSLMRQKYPYLNLIYSFGGWGSISHDNFQSGDFSIVFTYYPQNIPMLAKSMVAAMLKAGFNGIDVDYEWLGPFESDPANLGGHAPLAVPDPNNSQYYVTQPLTQAEADGYAELMYDIHHDLQALSNASQYLLTTALFSGADKIDELSQFKYQGSISALKGQSDLKIVLDQVNYVSLMTYDMHGAFDASPAGGHQNPDSISNFQSGFQHSPDDPTQNVNIKQYNVMDAVKALKAADPNDSSFSSEKIVLGIPAYTRIVRLDAQPANPTAYQAVGIFDNLAKFDQQAVLNSDVAGEFEGDYANQLQGGGGANEIGSTILDYKCILAYPNDNNNSQCYYSGYAGSHPIASDTKFYGMDQLPVNGAPGSDAATPWGYGPTSRTFMSFDNNLSAANKAKYIISNHLGGAMIWELDGDLAPTDARFANKSIVHAIYSVFQGA